MLKMSVSFRIKLLIAIILVLTLYNAKILNGSSGQSIQLSEIHLINPMQDGGGWIPENITQDLLEAFAAIFYVGDGSGLIEIIFNLIPFIGNSEYADDLIMPIFLLLFTGGAYFTLKKQGIIQ